MFSKPIHAAGGRYRRYRCKQAKCHLNGIGKQRSGGLRRHRHQDDGVEKKQC